jgi:hypothetical protein
MNSKPNLEPSPTVTIAERPQTGQRRATLLAQFHALQDSQARAEFWRIHFEEIFP